MVSCEELELGGVRDVAELVNTPHHARTDARRRSAVAVSRRNGQPLGSRIFTVWRI